MDGRAAPSPGWFFGACKWVQADLVERIDRHRPQVQCLHNVIGGVLFKGESGNRSQPAQMVAARYSIELTGEIVGIQG
jgi:hypothetical protein